MGNRGLTEVSLRLGPSRTLAALIYGSHGGAAGCALAAGMPVSAAAALLSALVLSAWYHLRRDAWRSRRLAATGLRVRLDGFCEIERGGGWTEARLWPACFVSPVLTLVVLRLEGRRLPLPVVIPFDAVPDDDYRRLRILLRLGAVAG